MELIFEECITRASITDDEWIHWFAEAEWLRCHSVTQQAATSRDRRKVCGKKVTLSASEQHCAQKLLSIYYKRTEERQGVALTN